MLVIKKSILYISLLAIFTVFINLFSGYRGVFPLDTFAFFDTGFRVLNGEHPFKDYWAVSGPFIDYSQAFLFYVFGVNWLVYLVNPSILNVVLVLSTFHLFKKLNIGNNTNLFFCFCLAILAYPNSGTPFVDHHSAFLSIIGIYFFYFAILNNILFIWFTIPPIFSFAFLSKQIPSSLILLTFILSLFYHLILNKRDYNLKVLATLICSTIITILFYLFVFKIIELDLNMFLKQYIFYPLTIGEGRFEIFKIDVNKIIFEFKFIHLSFLPYFCLNIVNFIKKKKYSKSLNFKVFLTFLQVYVFLLISQIITKNQIYIFFLIPIFSLLSFSVLKNYDLKYKNYIQIFIISICLFSTIKYFDRFIIHKKFHELQDVNFDNYADGRILDEKFYGLKWITPENLKKEKNVEKIEQIKQNKEFIRADNRKKMVLSKYSIYSTLTSESTLAPSRWYPEDGTGFPIEGSKYFFEYKNFLINLIISKQIEVIYLLDQFNDKMLLNYVDKDCFKISKKNNFTIYKVLNSCEDFNSKNSGN